MGSFAAIGVAGAQSVDNNRGPENVTCRDWSGADASNFRNHECFTVDTTVQPSDEVALGTPVHDDATVAKHWLRSHEDSVAIQEFDRNSFDRNVTFALYGTADCSGDPIIDPEVVPIGRDLGTVSSSDQTLAAGEYSYMATYNKVWDRGGEYAEGACEPFTVDQADPTLTTTVVPGDGDAPLSAYDTSVLSDTVDGFVPTGTVTYMLYPNSDCSGEGTLAGNAALVDGVPGNSDLQGPLAAGDYSFLATYSGDSNYTSQAATCEPFSATETAVVPSPAALTPAPKVVGAAARFTG